MQNIIHCVDSLKLGIVSSPEIPIFVQTVQNGIIDWNFIIPTLIALISTSIVIYDRIKRPKIGAKILSLAYSPKASFEGEGLDRKQFGLKGQQYFIKFSMNVIKKSFFFKNVLIKVKYPSDNQTYNAHIFWADPITWTFSDNKVFDLHIPKEGFLWFNNILPLNTVSFQYISFFVEVDKMEMMDEIEVSFIKPNGGMTKIKPMKIPELDPTKLLFDKEIWIERNV